MFKKPLGVWATFRSECHRCGDEITVTNARPDPHDCREQLQPMGEWQDALADYYDSGAIGAPPKRQRLEDIKFR